MSPAVIQVSREAPWVAERREMRRGAWRVIADQFFGVDGAVAWDVYAQHDGSAGVVGTDDDWLARVPRGPNVHMEPSAEMARLAGVVS